MIYTFTLALPSLILKTLTFFIKLIELNIYSDNTKTHENRKNINIYILDIFSIYRSPPAQEL